MVLTGPPEPVGPVGSWPDQNFGPNKTRPDPIRPGPDQLNIASAGPVFASAATDSRPRLHPVRYSIGGTSGCIRHSQATGQWLSHRAFGVFGGVVAFFLIDKSGGAWKDINT